MVEVGRVWLVSGEVVEREGPGVADEGLPLDEVGPTDSTCRTHTQ